MRDYELGLNMGPLFQSLLRDYELGSNMGPLFQSLLRDYELGLNMGPLFHRQASQDTRSRHKTANTWKAALAVT